MSNDISIKIKNKGALSIYGYHAKDPIAIRKHIILSKLLPKYGFHNLIEKLNAIAVLNKHNPNGRIFKSDKEYVERLYNRIA